MRALSARERRLLALGILVAAVAGAWMLVIDPVVGGFIDRADEREELMDRYARNERLLGGVPLWRAQAREQARTAQKFAILAPTEALAGEALKARLAQLGGGTGAVRAMQEIEQGVDPGWVRVRADLTLTLDQLYQGLVRLESGEPYVVVEYLAVNAHGALETGHLSPMDVRIEVSAPFRAAGGRT